MRPYQLKSERRLTCSWETHNETATQNHRSAIPDGGPDGHWNRFQPGLSVNDGDGVGRLWQGRRGGGSTAEDTIRVSKCFYAANHGTMLVTASSTATGAHLSLYLPSGAVVGEVQNGGNGQYGGTVFYVGPDPAASRSRATPAALPPYQLFRSNSDGAPSESARPDGGLNWEYLKKSDQRRPKHT